MKAGIRNRLAATHAAGSLKATAVKPKGPTRSFATAILAIISMTPDHIAKLVNPRPWMV